MQRILLIIGFYILAIPVKSQLDIGYNIDQARNEIFNRNENAAIDRLNRVIKSKPDIYQAYFFRGIAKFQLKDNSGAIEDFTRVIELNPFLPEAFHYRGIARSELLDYNKALNDFDKAISLDLNNPGIYISRGLTKINIKNFTAAIEDFNRALVINQEITEAYVYRAVALSGLKEYNAAIEDCNKALSFNQFYTQAIVQKGLIQYELTNYTDAINEFSKAIKIKPSEAYPYYARALAKLHTQDINGALSDYNKVVELNPYNALAFYNRAMLKSEIGSTNEAIKDLDRVIELSPSHILSYYNRGLMKAELNDFTGAILDFSKTIEIYPDFGEAYYMRAMAKRNIGNMRSAEYDYKTAMAKMNGGKGDTAMATINKEKFRKVIELEADFNNNFMGDDIIYKVFSGIDLLPDFTFHFTTQPNYPDILSDLIPDKVAKFAEYRLNYGNTIDTVTNYESLFNAIEVLLQKDKNSFNLWLFRGITAEKIKNFNIAIESFSKAAEINPESELPIFGRAYANMEMLDFINSINSGIQLNMNNRALTTNIKNETVQDYSSIIEDYNKAILLNPDLAVVYFNRANLRVKAQDYEGAIFDFERTLKLEPDFAEAYFNLALVNIYRQNTARACQLLSKAGELGLKKAYPVIKRYCSP
ncbi:MAG: tetratricopeptide repeat protein [Bacteroidales bacterium]